MANWSSNPTLEQSYTTPTRTTPTSGQRPGGSGWQQNRDRQLQSQYGAQNGMNRAQGGNAGAPAGGSQPAASASGVSPNGMPSATTAAGSPGAGWTQGADGGWLPPGHPAAAAAPGTGAAPSPALYSPYGAYPGRPQDTVAETTPYSDRTVAPARPNLSTQDGALLDALQGALASAPINRGAGKERAKEYRLSQQEQILDALGQSAASRGVDQGGNAQERAVRENTSSAIMEDYRGVDADAEAVDQERKLAASAALQSALGSIENRASNRFRDDLAAEAFGREGEVLENDRRRGDATDRLNAYTTDLGAFFENRSGNLANTLGMGGLELDRSRLGETQRQFNADYLLRLANFLEGNRQFGAGLNYNYAGLNAGLYNNYVNSTLGGTR